MPRVAVSIINYRTCDLTLAAVRSVLADLAWSGLDGEIVVIDNASGDGSDARIDSWIGANPGVPVHLVRSPVNSGFSGGHNLGISVSTAPFVLVLNSDAELRPGCLQALLDTAEACLDAGFVGPRIESGQGARLNSCFRFPGVFSEMIRGAHSGPVTRLLARWDVPLGEDPLSALIDWSEFSCILLRRAMIDAIGPMDEGYFLYFEDVEYCLRARRAGWRVRHAPEAVAIHHDGGSGDMKDRAGANRRLPAYYYASRTRYFYQSGGYPGLWAANAAWTAGRALAQVRRVLGKPVAAAAEREHRDIWTNALHPLGRSRGPGRAG